VTATPTLAPLEKIRPSEGFNPRSDFGEEQMAELIASVKRHGIITPLRLAPAAAGIARYDGPGAPRPRL